jgi:hypothetical protein
VYVKEVRIQRIQTSFYSTFDRGVRNITNGLVIEDHEYVKSKGGYMMRGK